MARSTVAEARISSLEVGGGSVTARSACGAEASCPLPPGADAPAAARFGARLAGRVLAAAMPATGVLGEARSLAAPGERLAFGAVCAALHALRLRVFGPAWALASGGGPATPSPAVIETERDSDADPTAACLDPASTLVVADATSAGGPDGLRDLAALARAFDVQLAIRPLLPDDAGEGMGAADLAATLGVALARRPGEALPPMPAILPGGGDLAVREVVLHRVALPLRDLYVSAMYLTERQLRTVVEIRTGGGVSGWGETHGAVAPHVAKLAQGWIGRDLGRERNLLRRRFARIGFDNRDGRNGWAAFAGLDLAAWDVAARWAGLSLGSALGGAPHEAGDSVEIACPLPAAVPGRMVTRAELAEHMADPGNAARVADLAAGIAERWGVRAFKYKSAGTGAAWDLAALSALRRTLGPAARLRFDPNAAYGTEEARLLCLALEPLDLEFYEDPTDGLEGMARVAAAVRTPLATNMCITAPEHLAAASRRAGSAPGVRCPGVSIVLGDLFYWGGVAGLRDMAAVARLLGMVPALHSFYETGLATAANAQIARALVMDRPHPMDCGWPLLAADIVDPDALAITDGRLAVPEGPGLGLVPDPERLDRLRTGEPVAIR